MMWETTHACPCGRQFDGGSYYHEEALSCPVCLRLVEPCTCEPVYESGDLVILTHQNPPVAVMGGDGLRAGEVADGAQVTVSRCFLWRRHSMVLITYPSPRVRGHTVSAWVYRDQLAPLPEATSAPLDEPTYLRRAH